MIVSRVLWSELKRVCGMRLLCSNVRHSESLERSLVQRILHTGALSVHEYMRETSSFYYTWQEAIGSKGDFVTSPEISQIFGETLAIWIVHECKKMGNPQPLQLVELGPGRGTLMSDVLRAFSRLMSTERLSVHLVESSPRMIDLQKRSLLDSTSEGSTTGESKFGPKVSWHASLQDVPSSSFSLFLAHEFFDALPVHKFVMDEESGKWSEILVDVDPTSKRLQLVRSKHPTPACSLIAPDEHRSSVEISPQSGLICQEICRRITSHGGLALFIDYGHQGEASDTIRGFYKHQVVDNILSRPGLTDLTADVDFQYLRTCALNSLCNDNELVSNESVEDAGRVVRPLVYGPITQRELLIASGIRTRAERLRALANGGSTSKETMRKLDEALSLLVDEDKMGTRFKAMAIFPHTMKPIHHQLPPIGFHQQ